MLLRQRSGRATKRFISPAQAGNSNEVFMSRTDSVSLFANPSGDFPQVDPTAYVDPAASAGHHYFFQKNTVGNIYVR